MGTGEYQERTVRLLGDRFAAFMWHRRARLGRRTSSSATVKVGSVGVGVGGGDQERADWQASGSVSHEEDGLEVEMCRSRRG